MVKDMVTRFVNEEIKPMAEELDRTHKHPREICRKLGEMGLMGVSVPTEFGGAGMDNVTYAMALIEISRGCASCGVITSVNNSLYGHPVKTYGTAEQKKNSWYRLPAVKWKVATPSQKREQAPMPRPSGVAQS